MKTVHFVFNLLILWVWCLALQAQTVDEYLQQAEEKSQSGDLEAAVSVMEKAVEAFPDSPTSHAFLGGYLTQSLGTIDDMMVKAARSAQAFEHLDKAVGLDSTHVYARFFRGLLGVMVPPFLGKLDRGIDDLKTVLEVAEADPEKAPKNIVTRTYHYLGMGYSKKGLKQEARTSWEYVIRRAPGTNLAEEAQAHLDQLSPDLSEQPVIQKGMEGDQGNEELERARAYINEGKPERAIEILENIVNADSSNARALAWLGLAHAAMAGQGYDKQISGDTDLRTNYALEGFRMIDEAVALAPTDHEIRFLRGMLGAELSSFMGKTDQAIEDLTHVIEHAPSDELKSNALYSLGVAYRRKGLSVWEDLVTEYPESGAVRRVFERMKPEESRIELSGISYPLIVLRFAIGFETELEPQTAVWIEDEDGRFVKTLYVSGFSGHVGATQNALSRWAEASKFETDANTGASIAAGWHSYLWDLTDHDGNPVPEGTYTVYVEVRHWPSMQYQLASAPIETGKGEKVSKAGAGNIIPFLEVRYIPE